MTKHTFFIGMVAAAAWLTGCAEKSAERVDQAPKQKMDSSSMKAEESAVTDETIAQLRDEAKRLEPFVTSDVGREFLSTAKLLPAVGERTLYRDKARKHYYTADEAAGMPDDRREALEEVEVDDHFYYLTRYGTPLAYTRALDILGDAGFRRLENQKILDFGYGGIGHLRMMALAGAYAVGVEIDPMLRALYSWPEDQGAVKGMGEVEGRVRLVHGRFPAGGATTAEVGDGYDLIISKNVLKAGYIHPAEPVDRRMMVELGVDDVSFVVAIERALAHGGYFMIYNICPAPAPPGDPYIPWADGRCPFPEDLFTSCGLRIMAYNQDDSEEVRKMAHLLGWDKGEGAMDLENDLFAHFTLVRKPY